MTVPLDRKALQAILVPVTVTNRVPRGTEPLGMRSADTLKKAGELILLQMDGYCLHPIQVNDEGVEGKYSRRFGLKPGQQLF